MAKKNPKKNPEKPPCEEHSYKGYKYDLCPIMYISGELASWVADVDDGPDYHLAVLSGDLTAEATTKAGAKSKIKEVIDRAIEEVVEHKRRMGVAPKSTPKKKVKKRGKKKVRKRIRRVPPKMNPRRTSPSVSSVEKAMRKVLVGKYTAERLWDDGGSVLIETGVRISNGVLDATPIKYWDKIVLAPAYKEPAKKIGDIPVILIFSNRPDGSVKILRLFSEDDIDKAERYFDKVTHRIVRLRSGSSFWYDKDGGRLSWHQTSVGRLEKIKKELADPRKRLELLMNWAPPSKYSGRRIVIHGEVATDSGAELSQEGRSSRAEKPRSKMNPKKRVTKKAVREALAKSSVPWEWVQQKPGRILASKGKRTVELRKWFKGTWDKGWVVSVIVDGEFMDEYRDANDIMTAIKEGEKAFKKKKLKKKRVPKKVTKKAARDALKKSSAPWKWDANDLSFGGRIVAQKGNLSVLLRQWNEDRWDLGWTVHAIDDGVTLEDREEEFDIKQAIKRGEKHFKKKGKKNPSKAAAREKKYIRDVTKTYEDYGFTIDDDPKKKTRKAKSGWQRIPHPEFPRYIWSASDTVTYTVRRMYGSMFADQHEYVYSVRREGPRSTTDISHPGYDAKHINKLSDAKAFAENDFKKKAKRKPAKKKPAKKKASKKKASKKKASKKTPAYQLLINRCQKLWTHYCDRPSKKRLEALYIHLDKMKESTSKKVATERSRCLRAANKEAKKLKYKRK